MNGANYAFKHGPKVTEKGVIYRLWSPQSKQIVALVDPDSAASARRIVLAKSDDGWFQGIDSAGKSGDLYEIYLDEKLKLPDVASRFQPRGIKGPSQVVPINDFVWHDQNWVRPPFKNLIIYELHIGTFTPKGTYLEAAKHFDYLKTLGVSAIELMPIGAFPGDRNWGYDVVLPFAPADSYGSPDDLRRMVEAAHKAGLTVILDVVYNHVCGEPNILQATSRDYFYSEGGNAWGSSLNFSGKNSQAVRDYFIENAIYWIESFHIDGLRLDATHAIVDESPLHVLTEIAEAVRSRGGFVIAEDERNDAKILRSTKEGGIGLDAAWADDFHHVVKMMLRPEPIGHFASYQGSPDELSDVINHGWLFRGQYFPQWKKKRGTESIGRPPQQFVYCISNHDQVGNRPLGERLNQLVDADAYRAASMFFLLQPYTPMLFMGQEWAAGSPFVFFTNHEGDFGKMVSEGRLREFTNFGSQWPAEMLKAMPDPETPEAFAQSHLVWNEINQKPFSEVLSLYRQCLNLRQTDSLLSNRSRENWRVWHENGCVFLQYGLAEIPSKLLVANLPSKNNPTEIKLPAGAWNMLLSSNDSVFGGTDWAILNNGGNSLKFLKLETLLLERLS